MGKECTVRVLGVECVAMGLFHTQATGAALENQYNWEGTKEKQSSSRTGTGETEDRSKSNCYALVCSVDIWTELLTETWFPDLRKHVEKASDNLRVDKCSKGRRNHPGLMSNQMYQWVLSTHCFLRKGSSGQKLCQLFLFLQLLCVTSTIISVHNSSNFVFLIVHVDLVLFQLQTTVLWITKVVNMSVLTLRIPITVDATQGSF